MSHGYQSRREQSYDAAEHGGEDVGQDGHSVRSFSMALRIPSSSFLML
jgi:hypothetical protein